MFGMGWLDIIGMSYLRGTYGHKKTFYGPEVSSRCLIKFHISHSQIKYGPEQEEGYMWAGCWFHGRR